MVILALCQRDHNDSLPFFLFFLSSLIGQSSGRAPNTNPLASPIYFLNGQNPFPVALSLGTLHSASCNGMFQKSNPVMSVFSKFAEKLS
jgi:hypothetical protein